MALYVLLGLTGLSLAVCGVYVLQGFGAALLAASASCFVVAGFLRQGLIRG